MPELGFYPYAAAEDVTTGARFRGPMVPVSAGAGGIDADALAGTALDDGFLNGTATVRLDGRDIVLTKVSKAGVDYYAASDGTDLSSLGTPDNLGQILTAAGFGRAAGLAQGFGRGTLIRTDIGQKRVERLRPGDLLITREGGKEPLLWHGTISVAARGDLMPVRVVPWSFGAWPTAPLILAPEQRIAVDDWSGEVVFGSEHVTGTAGSLAPSQQVHYAEDLETVEYHLLVLETPAILFANGAPCESFIPRPSDLARMERTTRGDLEQVLASRSDPYPESTYPVVSGVEIRKIVSKW